MFPKKIINTALVFFLMLPIWTGAGISSWAAEGSEEKPELPPDMTADFSIEGLQKQLTENPGRADLYFQLMIAYEKAGQFNAALALLEPLDKLDDNLWRSQAHLLAGRIMMDDLAPDSGEARDKALSRALAQFKMAVELDYPYPTNEAAYWYLGDLQAELGMTDDAIETLSTYLIMKPLAYDARLKLAELYIGKNETERAKTLLEGMVSDPNDERRGKGMKLLASLNRQWLGVTIVAVAGAAAIILFVTSILLIRKRRSLKQGD